MPDDLAFSAITALASLGAVAIMSIAGLKGLTAWLGFKHAELAVQDRESLANPAANRIELCDLKERLRKLEDLAAGVNL